MPNIADPGETSLDETVAPYDAVNGSEHGGYATEHADVQERS